MHKPHATDWTAFFGHLVATGSSIVKAAEHFGVASGTAYAAVHRERKTTGKGRLARYRRGVPGGTGKK